MRIFKFKETGNKYIVLSEGEFKHPETRKWIKAFIYTPVTSDSITGKIYVREVNEFLEKFEEEI